MPIGLPMTDGQAASVAVVGGGPAGLMAAEVLADAGVAVHLFDAMPSVGRKFLLAGRGGLNLTHSEPFDAFAARFGERRPQIEALLRDFGPEAVREWAVGLGVPTFVGSSGRVFPQDMKASPLLRAWLRRLSQRGVQFHLRHRWTGWADARQPPTCLSFSTPDGVVERSLDAVVLALGGASWPRLGSDAAWVPWLRERGLEVAPLAPANCGFERPWTAHFVERFAGQPFKSVAIAFEDSLGRRFARKGEFVATAHGIEGSLIYAASALLRDEISHCGSATLRLDLLPDRSAEQVLAAVRHPRGSRSLSSHLKSRLGLEGIKAGVLHEILMRERTHAPNESRSGAARVDASDAQALASAIKSLPIELHAARPIEEAISSAGGVRFEALDVGLMARALPGLHVAGEMLDWEAPTGGYLLTACFASGRAAARGVLDRLG